MNVVLVHWNEAEANARGQQLREGGFLLAAIISTTNAPANLKRALEDPVDAIVIDLSRLPSHGRDIALSVRTKKSTRHIPLILSTGSGRRQPA